MKKLHLCFFAIFILFLSCETDDINKATQEESEPQLTSSGFVGKWIVDGSNKSELKNGIAEKNSGSKINNFTKRINILNDANLRPFYVDNWDKPIVIKNKNVENASYMHNDDIRINDDIYIAFSYINDSNVDINSPFSINIYIDDTLVISELQEKPIYAGYYWSYWNYFISGESIAEGYHSIRMEIDSDNSISESNENDNSYNTGFIVKDHASDYYSFEFIESKYIITKANGDVLFGNLYSNSSKTELALQGFGTISINTLTNNEISFDVRSYDMKEFGISAYKAEEKKITNMTTKLTYDVWVLESTDSDSDIGEEWIFTKAGTYLFTNRGFEYIKYWKYKDESSFHYGTTPDAFQGTADITGITITTLDIKDSAGKYYHFER